VQVDAGGVADPRALVERVAHLECDLQQRRQLLAAADLAA
jgi:hypothetical protein